MSRSSDLKEKRKRRQQRDEREVQFEREQTERTRTESAKIREENLLRKRLEGSESKRAYIPQITSLRHAGQCPDSSNGFD